MQVDTDVGQTLVEFASIETHAENVAANDLYDPGEFIYDDVDDDELVSVGDERLTAANGYAAGTIVQGDTDVCFSLVGFEWPETHAENVAANDLYDPGEFIYNYNTWSVTVGDRRLTAADGYAAGTYVASGDTDVGLTLVGFASSEKHAENVAVNGIYDPGEYIYRDNDGDSLISDGDTRLTAVGVYPAGTTVNGGLLWSSGFTFTITYNKGNTARTVAALMVENSIENIEPSPGRFNIDVLEVIWSTYLGDLINYPLFRAKMPYFVIGWLADYTHPHSFLQPLFHTYGKFPYLQSYSNPTVDALIEMGVTTGSNRPLIYSQLQSLYHTEVPSLPLVQPLGRHYERTWVQGWYYNPLHGGSHALGIDSTTPATPVPYFYRLWKGLDADLNADGVVSVADGGVLSGHWHQDLGGGNFFDGFLGYNRLADIGPVTPPEPYGEGDGLVYPVDGLVDMEDVALLKRCYGPGPP